MFSLRYKVWELKPLGTLGPLGSLCSLLLYTCSSIYGVGKQNFLLCK